MTGREKIDAVKAELTDVTDEWLLAARDVASASESLDPEIAEIENNFITAIDEVLQERHHSAKAH